DLVEQRLLALEVVIQAGLGQTKRTRHVAHGGGVEAAVPKQLRGGAAHVGPPAGGIQFSVRLGAAAPARQGFADGRGRSRDDERHGRYSPLSASRRRDIMLLPTDRSVGRLRRWGK